MSSEAAREIANQIALIRGIGACKGVGSKKKKRIKRYVETELEERKGHGNVPGRG